MWPWVLTTEPQVTGKETKVQRSQVTCSRSHSWSGLGEDNVQGSTAPSSSSSLNQKHVSPHASRPQLNQRVESHVFQGEQAVDCDSVTRTFERRHFSSMDLVDLIWCCISGSQALWVAMVTESSCSQTHFLQSDNPFSLVLAGNKSGNLLWCGCRQCWWFYLDLYLILSFLLFILKVS